MGISVSAELLLTICVATVLLALLFTRTGKNLPPGPYAWPLIGNLVTIASLGLPHEALRKLAMKYGPIMRLYYGPKLAIVFSSADAAEEVLKKHDAVCANRPRLYCSLRLTRNGRDIAFLPYGPQVKKLRRIAITHLFTTKRIASWQPIREDEASKLVEILASECNKQGGTATVQMRPYLVRATVNNIMRMVCNRRYDTVDDQEFAHLRRMIDETLDLVTAFNLCDYVPALQRLGDPQGIVKRTEKVAGELEPFFAKLLSDYREAASTQQSKADSAESCFLDVLTELQQAESLENEDIEVLVQDMVFAGTDTSAVTMEWALAELLKNPGLLARVQEELAETDKSSAGKHYSPLLQAVVKETLRLHITVPLMLPHECSVEITVGNGRYTIPAGTMLQVNVSAIARDPSVWKDPETFRPERFLEEESDTSYKGTDFKFLPFGSGRRMCVGMGLGYDLMLLLLGKLLQEFEWEFGGAEGSEIDMSPGFALTVSLATPLVARIRRKAGA